jgi:hypothetical protein
VVYFKVSGGTVKNLECVGNYNTGKFSGKIGLAHSVTLSVCERLVRIKCSVNGSLKISQVPM